MPTIHGASRYERADDLHVITCFFNPSGYRTKLDNYNIFIETMRTNNLPVCVVECAFEDRPFSLPASPDVVQLRSQTVLFQKERLLNVALQHLPASCTKVAWLDCDILFSNPRWAVETSQALDHHPVVQPFSDALRLPAGARHYDNEGQGWRSFAAVCRDNPLCFLDGVFDRHGHTGFAWAARKDLLLKHGLFDGMVAGSLDHMMAHAILGDWSSACVRRIVGVNNPYAASLRDWSRALYADIQGSLGVVEGHVLHLWHGDMKNRRYLDRAKQLLSYGFDPHRDIRVGESGAWEWASHKPDLHQWAVEYFNSRCEDDAEAERDEQVQA